MPSVSKKQHNLMAAVAKNPKFAKKVGVPQSVGEEFLKADKGKQFGRGGEMKESKKMVAKELAFMKKEGAPKSMIKHEKAEAGMEAGGVTKKLPSSKQMGSMDMKKGGMCKKMARGGGIETKGKTKGTMVKMAAGGYVREADGCASKGKTKGKMVAMMKGGMTKECK